MVIVPALRKKTGAPEMRNPAREKQRDGGSRGISRVNAGITEEVAGMIKRHEYHNHAANHINRFEADTLAIRCLG
jgi:hypothetical protein